MCREIVDSKSYTVTARNAADFPLFEISLNH